MVSKLNLEDLTTFLRTTILDDNTFVCNRLQDWHFFLWDSPLDLFVFNSIFVDTFFFQLNRVNHIFVLFDRKSRPSLFHCYCSFKLLIHSIYKPNLHQFWFLTDHWYIFFAQIFSPLLFMIHLFSLHVVSGWKIWYILTVRVLFHFIRSSLYIIDFQSDRITSSRIHSLISNRLYFTHQNLLTQFGLHNWFQLKLKIDLSSW